MPTINFIGYEGNATEVQAEVGETVMEAGKRHGVAGIVAECGGGCSCATCHVYVDPAWIELVGAPGPDEEDMLDCAFDPQPNSRLSCQIVVGPEHDGLVMRLPERQV